MNKTKIIVCILCWITYASFAQNGRKSYTISDCITTFSEERTIKNQTGWAFWFIPASGIADTLSVKMSCVDKGIKTHEPHSHYEDELFYMVEGSSIVRLNGEEHILNPGDAFYAPGNSSHNIRRVENDQPIRYLMFKREIRGKLSVPFLPALENYTMKDCLVPRKAIFSNDKNIPMWYLKKEMSKGLSARLYSLAGSDRYVHDGYVGQEVYFIVKGKAEVSMNGESRIIGPLSSFYCPAGTEHGIRKVDEEAVEFIVVRTK